MIHETVAVYCARNLGCDVEDVPGALMRVLAERDAYKSSFDALVTAVREERASNDAACADLIKAAWADDANVALDVASLKHKSRRDAANECLVAILDGAHVAMVRASVVQEYLDAREAWTAARAAPLDGRDLMAMVDAQTDTGKRMRRARAALDAELARCR